MTSSPSMSRASAACDRGRFAAWELLALDLDIMVRLDINIKE